MPKIRNVVLTFDDAVVNHLSTVVPLLREYGFGATFFICRCAGWIKKDPECYLTGRQVREIYDAGFEIGNHTLNHVDLRRTSEEDGRREVVALNEFLAEQGIPAPESFAYPGGPYAAGAARYLGEYGLRCARTTGKMLWKHDTDLMNVASYSINRYEEDNFRIALSSLAAADGEPAAAVLVYHGVPDIAHPHCDTPPEMFRRHMEILRDGGFRVMSMGECRRLLTER